ncbi:MAG: DUF5906 domain-containing protein [ANME-2 cluster archaeon]|nr:DUF5906 domain-containing protein [ANME-2 cluster archaeon]
MTTEENNIETIITKNPELNDEQNTHRDALMDKENTLPGEQEIIGINTNSNPIDEEFTPDVETPVYKIHYGDELGVMGRKFTISTADIKFGEGEIPGNMIQFNNPYIRWLVYYPPKNKDKTFWNYFVDENEKLIIPLIKSKNPPWVKDENRDKEIKEVFTTMGWKPKEAKALMKVVQVAFTNKPELNMEMLVYMMGNRDTDEFKHSHSEYGYAEHIMENNHLFSNYGDQIYKYENGVYKWDRKADDIKKQYRKIDTDEWTVATANSVLAQILIETRKNGDEINCDNNIVNFKNGLYDLRTGVLSNHTPEFISTIQIPHDYLVDVKKSTVLNDIVEGILKPNDIKTFKQFTGYCLTTKISMKKTAFIVGIGDTGKTTLLEILQRTIGYINRSKESMDKLMNDKFSTFELKDKLLNCHDDVSNKTVFNTEMIKELSGGSPHGTAEEKGIQKHTYTKTAKILFCGNNLPQLFFSEDLAYRRRWILFECINVRKASDPGGKTLDELMESISEEDYSAFIKECLDAFREVMDRNEFTLSESNKNVIRTYELLSNPVKVFIDECTAPYGSTPKISFLNVFNNWAVDNEISTTDAGTMGKRMGGKHGLGYQREFVEIAGMKMSYWSDISIPENMIKKYGNQEKTDENGADEDFCEETPNIVIPKIEYNSAIKVF